MAGLVIPLVIGAAVYAVAYAYYIGLPNWRVRRVVAEYQAHTAQLRGGVRISGRRPPPARLETEPVPRFVCGLPWKNCNRKEPE